MNTVVTDSATVIPFLQPMKDRVLVKRVARKEKEGLVWIPETSRENADQAHVVACGPKVTGVKNGDLVIVPGAGNKYPDWELSDYVIIQEADIAGILEP